MQRPEPQVQSAVHLEITESDSYIGISCNLCRLIVISGQKKDIAMSVDQLLRFVVNNHRH